MNFLRLDIKDFRSVPLRMRLRKYENGYQSLEIGPRSRPLRISINLSTPPELNILNNINNVEILTGHLYVKARNKIILSKEAKPSNHICVLFIETILPKGFKNRKPIQVYDKSGKELNQRIYCDRTHFYKTNSGFIGSKFLTFAMLYESDKCRLYHTDPVTGDTFLIEFTYNKNEIHFKKTIPIE